MKRFIAGLIIGVILMLAAPAFGDGVIGKVVEGTLPLVINGKKAMQDVIVIEGTSYLPVREACKMFGYNVSWNQETREVILETKDHTLSKAGYYTYKTKLFDIWEPELKNKFFVMDGAQYIPYQIFNNYPHFEIPGHEPYYLEIEGPPKEYTKGCVYFIYITKPYIKASELGLKARIDGDTVWIEELE